VLVRRILDARLELLTLVGEGQLGALAMHRLGDAGGDGAFAGNAGDQYLLAAQESHCQRGITSAGS